MHQKIKSIFQNPLIFQHFFALFLLSDNTRPYFILITTIIFHFNSDYFTRNWIQTNSKSKTTKTVLFTTKSYTVPNSLHLEKPTDNAFPHFWYVYTNHVDSPIPNSRNPDKIITHILDMKRLLPVRKALLFLWLVVSYRYTNVFYRSYLFNNTFPFNIFLLHKDFSVFSLPFHEYSIA